MAEPLLPPSVVRRAIEPFLDQAVRPASASHDRDLPGWSRRLYSYTARAAPLDAQTLAVRHDRGLLVEHVRYRTGPLTSATAFVLHNPEQAVPLPGVLAFHCHSGVYRWGKEKIAPTEDEPDPLTQFRSSKYSGRILAAELARAGFLVVVPDAFYFGERALGDEALGAAEDEIDGMRRRSEEIVAKALHLWGQSWPALLAWEDRCALDYLWARPELDRHGVGCMGLSLGGFRSMLLAARDARVSAIVTAGWLTTGRDLMAGKIYRHSWMVLPSAILPRPDIPALAAAARPAAFLALMCAEDHLFTRAEAEQAARRVRKSYARAGMPDRCRTESFATPHRLTEEMLTKATDWLRAHLGGLPSGARTGRIEQ